MQKQINMDAKMVKCFGIYNNIFHIVQKNVCKNKSTWTQKWSNDNIIFRII